MTYPASPDHSTYRLRPIRQGETYSRSVEGGCIRTPAPGDGVVVEQDDREIFIALADLTAALAHLAPRAAPRRAGLPLGTRRLPGEDPDRG